MLGKAAEITKALGSRKRPGGGELMIRITFFQDIKHPLSFIADDAISVGIGFLACEPGCCGFNITL